MITNLVASLVVSLLTNTSERFPSMRLQVPCPDHIERCLVYHTAEFKENNPTNKWIMTTVTRQSVATFTWDGKPYSVTNSELLSQKEVEFKLETQWKTNRSYDVSTNSIIINGMRADKDLVMSSLRVGS